MLGVARKAVDVDTFAPSQSRNRIILYSVRFDKF